MNISNSDIQKFWYFVEKTGTCWLYNASRNIKGYGRFSFFDKDLGKQKTVGAHRLSYELSKGPVPDNLFICHKCDNPSCVNPEHLFIGTNLENVRDMVRKGRNSPKPFWVSNKK